MTDDPPLSVRSRRGIERALSGLHERYGAFPVERATVEHEAAFEGSVERVPGDWMGTASAWISDADGRVLFLRRAAASDRWTLPDALRTAEESLDGTAARAVAELTGIDCALSGVRRAERIRIVDSAAPERRYYALDVTFEGRYVAGSLALAEEGSVLEARWFDERPDRVAAGVRAAVDEWFDADGDGDDDTGADADDRDDESEAGTGPEPESERERDGDPDGA